MPESTDRFRRPVYVDRRTGRLFADPLVGNGKWFEIWPDSIPIGYKRWVKTAAGGETSAGGVDDSGNLLEYAVGGETVYLNGVLLTRGTDYSAINGTTVTGLSPLTASDVLTVLSLAWVFPP